MDGTTINCDILVLKYDLGLMAGTYSNNKSDGYFYQFVMYVYQNTKSI